MFVITRAIQETGQKQYLGKGSSRTRILWKNQIDSALTFASMKDTEKSGFDMRGLVTGVNIERLG
jgi:hypothetical protein